MRVLTVSGSLRHASTNTAALGALALLAPVGIVVTPYTALAGLPAFNPDLDSDLPSVVQHLRQEIAAADLLVISSPEYARGMAGALKNLLDWLVGGPEFVGKRVALITTSQRAEFAPAQLRRVVETMSGTIVADVILPLLGQTLTPGEIAAEPSLGQVLRQIFDCVEFR